jgi:hypothetical protein
MKKKIEKINKEIKTKIKPSEVRQHYILFKNAEFDCLMKLEKEMNNLGIFGKSRIIAVASELLLKELEKGNE